MPSTLAGTVVGDKTTLSFVRCAAGSHCLDRAPRVPRIVRRVGEVPDFDSHALNDAFAEIATGAELRAALVASESYSELVTLIEQLELEDVRRTLLASILDDIRHLGRVLPP